MDHRLQTKEAVEEELAIQQMQTGASPNSKLAANYILSEQHAAKTAATVPACHSDINHLIHVMYYVDPGRFRNGLPVYVSEPDAVR